VSTGVHGRKRTRKAQTIVNLSPSLYPSLFWDGRAATLEAQALLPVVNPIEMGNSVEGALETLRSIEGYRKYFEEAFGSPITHRISPTTSSITKASDGFPKHNPSSTRVAFE